ncbi:PstS family phosphate ABC transporter substrate-binding protein [Haloplanus aerogenes]|uniref:Phosphate ABC transporter substrate-binding protein n=1 Tax=Haloplanus aerogenes TaxID=660522 RepID=A0A3M0DSM1_9EURY|nr:substrate-binding domain-containing protein [Haloplanus aerogenes]AZH24592.1 phosphate ABC transporter substrate-binding protein [Haloplanus aerogenes]RMB23750.1 phosphate ABC transporter substrate-binding protein (PhoT family) [Haloplanus aerogenes]
MVDSNRTFDGASRRKFMLVTGTGAVAGLAGCGGQSGGSSGGESGGSSGGSESDGTPTQTESNDSSSSGMDTSVLTADGSSTVFPITNTGASYWNSNPEAGDEDYWPQSWASEEYDTDMRLADFFAQDYGYESTGQRSVPPFRASVALSHSGTGVEGVMEGRVDIGDSSAPAQAELAGSGVSDATLDKFTDHVVGVDGQPIVVSREIYDAGVTQITIEQLRQIYRQEITNWSELGGPDREILALGRAEGSGTDTAFRNNVFGDPNAPISPDQRFGQNQQLQQAIGQVDNAIAYIALAFVEPDGATPPIGLEIDGTVYEYGNNLGAQEYPLSRDLHAYTWEGTSRKEACFINFLLSDFGQETFVASNNYFKLPKDRLRTEREKVAPSNFS